MQQKTKQFAEKLNHCLDELGAPDNIRDRSNILSKMLHIPKQEARALLEGHVYPNEDLLIKITTELEVERKWLETDL